MSSSPHGFVKIPRIAYASDPFWREPRTFSKWEAWEWMVQAASWRHRVQVVDMSTIDLHRGEFLASLRFMAEVFGWTVKRTRNFLRLVTQMGRIRAQRQTPAGTIYLVVNYDREQGQVADQDTPHGTPEARRGHARGTPEAQIEAVEADQERKQERDTSIIDLSARVGDERVVDEIILATNRGIMANPEIGEEATPIPAQHASRQVVHEWLADGIPADAIRSVVEERARAYRPSGRHKRPASMKYFDGAVREEWDRIQAASSVPANRVPKRMMRSLRPPPDEQEYIPTVKFTGLKR